MQVANSGAGVISLRHTVTTSKASRPTMFHERKGKTND